MEISFSWMSTYITLFSDGIKIRQKTFSRSRSAYTRFNVELDLNQGLELDFKVQNSKT